MARAYTRSFDWGEAKRMRRSGMPYARIGERLGVSASAVRLACDDAARERAARTHKEWIRGGTCTDCGAQITRNATRPAKRCRSCAAAQMATSVREHELRCVRCKRWKPDAEFPSNVSAHARRGRHRACRVCQTVMRRERRERNKVLCAGGCGKKVAARKDAGVHSGTVWTGMCISCANRTRRARADG